MAEFLVSGYYGDNNAGDEAILAGMIKAVRALDPEASFTVISKKAAQTRAVHGVNAISRNQFRETWQAMRRADLVISGGGSLLQDVTSTKSLLYYLGMITMGKMRLKPVMIYGQGIGPVVSTLGRTLVPTIVNGVDLITVRDPESAETLKRLGVRRPKVAVTADSALALGQSDPEVGADLLKAAGADLGRPLIGVSVRSWRSGEHPWEPELARSLDLLAVETGATIAFIPMQVPRDVEAAATIARLMHTGATVISGELIHDQIQAMVARCDLMIGMRYHALVFAAMNGVPMVGLSYDPKNDSFLRLIGERSAGRMDRLEASSVVETARRALGGADALRAQLRQHMARLTPLSLANARMAVDLVRQRGGKR